MQKFKGLVLDPRHTIGTSFKQIRYLLSNPAYGQTEGQTHKQTRPKA